MTTLVRNIGTLVSGDIGRPLLDADSLVIREGRIAAVGRGLDEDADTVIDARGTTVTPGLIDSHVHRRGSSTRTSIPSSATSRRASARSISSTRA